MHTTVTMFSTLFLLYVYILAESLLLFVYVLEVLVFTQQNLFPCLPRTLFHPPNPLLIMFSNKCFILLFQICVLNSQFLLLRYHLLESPSSVSSILL